MRLLNVYLYDQLIGHLKETRKGARFEYEPSVIERYESLPYLSLSLPVKGRPFAEGKTAYWFEGLLPEGKRREDICKNLHISVN